MQRTKYLSWEVKDPEYVKVKYLKDKKDSYFIIVRPKDSFLYHYHFKIMVGKFIFRGGLKVKDWYYTEENPEIEKYREITTYTLFFF